MACNESIKKPLIRQAGSAEAFAGSTAAGSEQLYYTSFAGKSKKNFSRIWNR